MTAAFYNRNKKKYNNKFACGILLQGNVVTVTTTTPTKRKYYYISFTLPFHPQFPTKPEHQ